MKEIKDIAMYEETDSILAKNTIGRLTNEVRTAYDRGYCDCSRHDRDDLERKHQQLEHIEQVNKDLYERIDKAIEHLHKRNEQNSSALTNKEETIISKHELLKLEITNNKILEDILRGEIDES